MTEGGDDSGIATFHFEPGQLMMVPASQDAPRPPKRHIDDEDKNMLAAENEWHRTVGVFLAERRAEQVELLVRETAYLAEI